MNFIILLILFPDGGYFGGGESFTSLPPQDFNQDGVYETATMGSESFYISGQARLFHYFGGFLKFGAPSFKVLSNITNDTLLSGALDYIQSGIFASIPLLSPRIHLDLLGGIRYQEIYQHKRWNYIHNVNYTYVYGLNLSILLWKIVSLNFQYLKIQPFSIDATDIPSQVFNTNNWHWVFFEPEFSAGITFRIFPLDTTSVPAW